MEKYQHIDTNNEKIIRIVNAGFQEFGSHDLNKSSLNSILKLSKISKGVFYHYFKDKNELYDFLIFYSIKLTAESMDENINWNKGDFLERILDSVIAKLKLYERYPYILDFFQRVVEDKGSNRVISEQFTEYYPNFREKFYNQNLKYDGVKDEIDIDKMINTIKFTLKQIGQDYLKEVKHGTKIFNIEEVTNIYKEYIDFFRRVFYK